MLQVKCHNFVDEEDVTHYANFDLIEYCILGRVVEKKLSIHYSKSSFHQYMAAGAQPRPKNLQTAIVPTISHNRL
jgi:hypothetical protein